MEGEEANQAPVETDALFVVTVNGPAACSEVATGLDGVHEAILRAIWRGPRDAIPDDLDAHLASLRDAVAWVKHGYGDGRPFWHWWVGFSNGSISVQRITAALPADPGVIERRQAMSEALAAYAAELRQAALQTAKPDWMTPGQESGSCAAAACRRSSTKD